MSNSSPSEQEFQQMLKHLNTLYTTAQVLTLDAEKAAQLVEETFQTALQLSDNNTFIPGDRRHLTQLLIQLHKNKQAPAPSPEPNTQPATAQKLSSSIKQNIIEQFLNRAAPTSYANLKASDRILLSLCESNKQSHTDIALILKTDPESIGQQLEGAKKRLKASIWENALPAERNLLHDSDDDKWLTQAINIAIRSELHSTPPTLEAKVNAAFTRQNPEGARRALESQGSKRSAGFSRGLMTLFIVITVGFIGYMGSSFLEKEHDVNLLTLSASQAPSIKALHATEDLSEAEKFVQQQLSWRLSLPEITDGLLTGVGISEIADQVRVPVFIYRDNKTEDKEYITLYTFNYALLDEFADRIQLERDILDVISNERMFDLHDLNDDQKFVIWRKQDDIFLAVTAGNPQELRDRIMIN